MWVFYITSKHKSSQTTNIKKKKPHDKPVTLMKLLNEIGQDIFYEKNLKKPDTEIHGRT